MLDTSQLPLSGSPLLWFRQGLLFASTKEYEQAVVSFDCVLRARPDCFEAWYERGLALENLGAYDEAIASYDRALQLRPRSEVACEIWHSRGDALQYGLGNYEAAILSYDRTLQIQPDHYRSWQNRGNALLYGVGHYEAAIASYDRVILINPNYYLAWRNRGNALVELKRYDEAITSYDRALTLEPNDQVASYARSCALEKSGLDYKQPTTNPVWYGRGYSESNPLEEPVEDLNETLIVDNTAGQTVSPPKPVLMLEDEQGKREIVLGKAMYSIGRDPRNDICIRSQFVSRHHATLIRLEQGSGRYRYQIVDGDLEGKRSTNGLLINGRKRQSWQLNHEDLVVFSPQARAIFMADGDR